MKGKYSVLRCREMAGKFPAAEIADKMGISQPVLRAYASRDKISLRFKNQVWDPKDDDKIRIMRAAGMSVAEIALAIGRPEGATLTRIKHNIRHNGWYRSDNGFRRKQATNPDQFSSRWLDPNGTRPDLADDRKVVVKFHNSDRELLEFVKYINWAKVRRYRVVANLEESEL